MYAGHFSKIRSGGPGDLKTWINVRLPPHKVSVLCSTVMKVSSEWVKKFSKIEIPLRLILNDP